ITPAVTPFSRGRVPRNCLRAICMPTMATRVQCGFPMRYFLAKSEPGVYSIDQLERDKKTVWDGVTNPQAVRAIRSMKSGDRVVLCHSGGVPAIVGLATIRSDGRDDPKNPKSAVADFEFLCRLNPPTTLAEIKQSG